MALIEAMWRATPWAPVGIAVTVVVALVAARPVGRWLRTSAIGTLLWLLILGCVLTLTATPGLSYFAARSCALGLVSPLPARELFALGEESLNVWMFVPLALMATLPRSRRATRVALCVTFALPVVLEVLQWALPAMGRACQASDIVNNLTGAVIGVGVGTVLRIGYSRSRSRSGSPAVAVGDRS